MYQFEGVAYYSHFVEGNLVVHVHCIVYSLSRTWTCDLWDGDTKLYMYMNGSECGHTCMHA